MYPGPLTSAVTNGVTPHDISYQRSSSFHLNQKQERLSRHPLRLKEEGRENTKLPQFTVPAGETHSLPPHPSSSQSTYTSCLQRSSSHMRLNFYFLQQLTIQAPASKITLPSQAELASRTILWKLTKIPVMCLGVQTSGGSDRSRLPEKPRLLLIHVYHLWVQQGINEQSLSEKAGRKEEAAAISPRGSLATSSKVCVPEQSYIQLKQASL